MKPALSILLCILFALCGKKSSAAAFNIYLPSRTTGQLWIVTATETGKDLSFTVTNKVDLGFPAATIVAHPDELLLYHPTKPCVYFSNEQGLGARYLLATAFKSGILHAFRITRDGDLVEAATLHIDEKISDLVTK